MHDLLDAKRCHCQLDCAKQRRLHLPLALLPLRVCVMGAGGRILTNMHTNTNKKEMEGKNSRTCAEPRTPMRAKRAASASIFTRFCAAMMLLYVRMQCMSQTDTNKHKKQK